MEEREQSEFNMAVSWLNRLNVLFYLCDEAAMDLNVYDWYHTLMALIRELSTEMKPEEMTAIEKDLEAIHPGVNQAVKEYKGNPRKKVNSDLYHKMHKIEIRIRMVLKAAGLQTRIVEEARRSLR